MNPKYMSELISQVMKLEKAQEIAENFMKTNGYKLTEIGRNQAMIDLQNIDDESYNKDDLLILQCCIAIMKIEEK